MPSIPKGLSAETRALVEEQFAQFSVLLKEILQSQGVSSDTELKEEASGVKKQRVEVVDPKQPMDEDGDAASLWILDNSPEGEPSHNTTTISEGCVEGRGGKRKEMEEVEGQVQAISSVSEGEASTQDLASAIAKSKLEALLVQCKNASVQEAGDADKDL